MHQVGPYTIVSELGRGGMGAVYRAREGATGREVALKLVLASDLSEARRERFRREGQVTAGLEHPGIVRVHTAGEDEHGHPWIAYELVEAARTLGEAFEDLELADRVRLVRDAAEALGFAHGQGIVHRDVKPENLLVDADGRMRVADFGLAYAGDMERLTRTGAWVGTPRYMAPEQFKGQAVGPSADVWSLGVVLYTALTGKLPFGGDTPQQLIADVMKCTPDRPSSVSGEVYPALERVCLRALSREPDDRYPTGAELAAALDLALQDPGSSRRRALPLAALLTLVVGALALLLANALTSAPQPADGSIELPPPETDTPPRPKTPRPLTGAERALAKKALRDLRRLKDPQAKVTAAEEWLEAYPGHSRAAQVEAVRDEALRRFPLARAVPFPMQPDEEESHFTMVGFLDAHRVVAAWRGQPRGTIQSYAWDPEARTLKPAPPLLEATRVYAMEVVSGSGLLAQAQGGLRWLRDGADIRMVDGEGRPVGALPGRPNLPLEMPGLSACAQESGGLLLAVSPMSERGVRVFRADAAGRAILVFRPEPPPGLATRGLALSPDGRALLVGYAASDEGGASATTVIYDLTTQGEVVRVRLRANLLYAAFSPGDGKAFATGTGWGMLHLGSPVGGLRLLRDVAFEREHPNIQARSHLGPCVWLQFDRRGERLYSLAYQGGGSDGPASATSLNMTGNELRVWEVPSGRLLRRVETTIRPHAGHLDPSGRFLVLGSREGEVEVWSAR